MTINFTPGSQQWLGIAKETTYGVAAAAPTVWIPVSSPKYNPNVSVLTDQFLRGMMATDYQATQGMSFSELSYQTMIYKDSVFQHLVAILGMADTVVSLAATTLTKGTTATTGGTLPAGNTYWKVTPTAPGGEGIGSNEVTALLTGATSTQVLSWTAVTGATGYNVYRGVAAGAENVLVASLGNVLTYTDIGTTLSAGAPPATAANIHKTALLNTSNGQPQSWTGWLLEGDKCEQIPGMVAVDVKFTFVTGANSTVDVSWAGMPGTLVTPPTNTPSAVAPFAPYTTLVNIGGSVVGSRSGATIDLKRATVPMDALNGTAAPVAIFGGPLSVSGTIDAIFQGSTDPDLVNLLTNAQPSLTITSSPQNDSAHPITLRCSQIAYTSAAPVGSNTSWMTISSAFTALANATDALDGMLSPVQGMLCTTSATPF
jgi:hypothetical protein